MASAWRSATPGARPDGQATSEYEWTRRGGHDALVQYSVFHREGGVSILLLSEVEKNGAKMETQYKTDNTCRRFVEYIYDDVMRPTFGLLGTCQMMGIMFDGATDKSVSEMELVYARAIINGRAHNMYSASGYNQLSMPILMVFTMPSTTCSLVWGFLTGGPRWLEWGAMVPAWIWAHETVWWRTFGMSCRTLFQCIALPIDSSFAIVLECRLNNYMSQEPLMLPRTEVTEKSYRESQKYWDLYSSITTGVQRPSETKSIVEAMGEKSMRPTNLKVIHYNS